MDQTQIDYIVSTYITHRNVPESIFWTCPCAFMPFDVYRSTIWCDNPR